MSRLPCSLTRSFLDCVTLSAMFLWLMIPLTLSCGVGQPTAFALIVRTTCLTQNFPLKRNTVFSKFTLLCPRHFRCVGSSRLYDWVKGGRQSRCRISSLSLVFIANGLQTGRLPWSQMSIFCLKWTSLRIWHF